MFQLARENPSTVHPEVRDLRPGEAGALSATLAMAMREDPFLRWLSGGRIERAQAFLRLGVERLALPQGRVLVTRGLSGGVLLLRPDALPAPPTQSLAMLPGMARSVGVLRVPTVLRALICLEQAHPPEPHWTGLVLGVDPAARGDGLGGALVRAALEVVDADGAAAYLETCGGRGLGLYAQAGFTLREQVELPGGGPTMDVMWRPARG